MSYNVRDDNAIFGPSAAVELLNGAGASTIANLQTYELVGLFGATGSGGTAPSFVATTVYTTFIAPPNPSTANSLPPLGSQYKVAGISIFYATAASGAATIAFEICAAGVANGSGTNVLAGTNYALNTVQSNTPANMVLNTNVDNLLIAPGGRLNFTSGATATTGLVDLTVVAYLIRTA